MTQICSPDFSITIDRQTIEYPALASMGPDAIDALRQQSLKKTKFHENAGLITGVGFFGAAAAMLGVEMESIQTAFTAGAGLICFAAMGRNIQRHRRHSKNACELDQAMVVLSEDATQSQCEETNDILVQKGILHKVARKDGMSYLPVLRYYI